MNKRKLLFVLRSSKTHDVNVEPQLVKIASTKMKKFVTKQNNTVNVKQFCPYHLIQTYLAARGKYFSLNESFFILPDHSAVKQKSFRITLRKYLALAGFEVEFFSGHSFCMRRALHLLHYGLSVETIKKLGRWRSNSIYAYLKY